MAEPVKVRPRTRAGSWETFDRRYGRIPCKDGSPIWQWWEVEEDLDIHHIWTVVDADGVLYVVPGYASVNYIGRLVTKRAWGDVEFMNPGYRY